jgi:drug/metabolite transporter (DMT)-like permease
MDSIKAYLLDRLPLFYVFLSGIGFSIQTLIIKLLSELNFKGSFYCVFSRGVNQLIISTIFIIYYDYTRPPGEEAPQIFGNTTYVRTIMVLRAVIGFFSIAFSFLSAEYISIGDSTVLVMLSPIVAALASFVILGEPWYVAEFCATLLSITGAVLVAKPPFLFGDDKSITDHHSFYLGVFFSLFAALNAGFAFVLIRMLGTSAKMPWANVCLIQSLAQIILSVPSLYIAGQSIQWNMRWEIWFFIMIGGFIGAWSQIAMTLGMQREKSAAASAMRMSDVVFGFIWQVLFTTDPLNWLSLTGAILVTGSILVIVIFKSSSSSSPLSSTEKTSSMKIDSGIEMKIDHRQSLESMSSTVSSSSSPSSSSSHTNTPTTTPSSSTRHTLTSLISKSLHKFTFRSESTMHSSSNTSTSSAPSKPSSSSSAVKSQYSKLSQQDLDDDYDEEMDRTVHSPMNKDQYPIRDTNILR